MEQERRAQMNKDKERVLEMLITAGKKIASLAERVATDELDLDSFGMVCYVAESQELGKVDGDLEPGAYPFSCSNYTAGPEWVLEQVVENVLLDLMPEGGPLVSMKWLADITEGVIRKRAIEQGKESGSQSNVIPFPGGNQWKQ